MRTKEQIEEALATVDEAIATGSVTPGYEEYMEGMADTLRWVLGAGDLDMTGTGGD